MKKDIFTVWLKEFCSLVFTQAVQAFLLAAIMSVIVATASGNLDINKGSAVSATGIIAIIALSALSKVELLVKKIFGIESQFGDPAMKNGMAGLAGTLIGAKLAGRVLNNVGKVGAGAIDVGRAAREKARIRRNYARDLSNLGAPPSNAAATTAATIGAGAGAAAGAAASSINGGNSVQSSQSSNGNSNAQSSSANGSGNSQSSSSSGNAAQQPSTLTGAVTLAPNSVTVNGSNVNVDGKQSASDKQAEFNRKKADILEKYEDALKKANEQTRSGLAKMGSGVTESVGGIAGGIAGATVGLATGDGILTKTGAGMGIGDYVGETTVKTVKTIDDTRITINDNRKERDKATKAVSDLTGKDISNYRTAIKDLEKYASRLGDITDDAAKKTDAGNI